MSHVTVRQTEVALAFASDVPLAFAFVIERGFNPASRQPRSGLPLCRRPERSPKVEATDLWPLLLPLHFFAFWPKYRTPAKASDNIANIKIRGRGESKE
jgi:hypothetical protein